MRVDYRLRDGSRWLGGQYHAACWPGGAKGEPCCTSGSI